MNQTQAMSDHLRTISNCAPSFRSHFVFLVVNKYEVADYFSARIREALSNNSTIFDPLQTLIFASSAKLIQFKQF